jgi:LmbE family N-acetylglucosaminyl deacetylase
MHSRSTHISGPLGHWLHTLPRSSTAVAFDPAFPGTPECVWQSWLDGQPAWAPRRGPLLVVSPHPDDEIFGAGGLMRTWCAQQLPVMLLSVTDGEAAYPDWQELKSRRRKELDRALDALKVPGIHTVRLSLNDGGGSANQAAIEASVMSLCGNRPTLIAPYERDGHPDHQAAGRACLDVARALQLPIARYPIWAWHHSQPHDFKPVRVGRFELDADTQAAKANAIQCFASQLAPPSPRVPIVPSHVLSYFERSFEAFIL